MDSSNQVVVYDDSQYQGFAQTLEIGNYDWGQIHNDTISSLKVPAGMTVTLYSDTRFSGQSKTFTADAPYVGDDFNDMTSSIRVELRVVNTPYKVLNYLYGISGSKSVAGQHNREPISDPVKWTTAIHSTTGKYPGFWSSDFLFQQDNIGSRQTMIDEAKSQWNQGAIVHLMYHACPPTQSEACGWSGGVQSPLSDDQWNELVTDGTALNNVWKSRLDRIAVFLQDLKDHGVEVLWRPLHEMNQGAFWWGGRPGANGTRKLYQITHDYLVKTKGLTNLIWVWNMQDFPNLNQDLSDYNPGDSYWDIATLDIYRSDGQGYTQDKYNAMITVAGGKPIAIGECDVLPTANELAAQPLWTFWMAWAELVYEKNSEQAIRDLYNTANVLTRDQLPGWGG